ncbi:MAG TPA: hypothetical protein VGQ38_05005 [Gaiellaceae bacterium]|jgi:hypothetical protein|nr:hypothetical protein [Gaiellaceae bacterium]
MNIELARQHWLDGNRRIEATRSDRTRYAQLQRQVDIVVGALRKRVGQVFTLAELADAYDGADEWARSLLDDVDPEAPPATEPGTVADAAFHAYARGAADYRP